MAKAKVTSRHQALVKMGRQVATIAGALKGLAETLAKEDAERVKRFAEIEKKADWLADELTDEHVTTGKRIQVLEDAVLFLSLPFWKRWWRRWRAGVEATKNAHRTVALMPQPADYPGPGAPPEQPTPAEGSLVADKGGPSATLLPDSPDKRGSEGASEEAPPDSDGLSDEAGAKSDKPGGSGPMVDGPSEETGGSVTSAAAPNDSDGLPVEEGAQREKIWPRSTEADR